MFSPLGGWVFYICTRRESHLALPISVRSSCYTGNKCSAICSPVLHFPDTRPIVAFIARICCISSNFDKKCSFRPCRCVLRAYCHVTRGLCEKCASVPRPSGNELASESMIGLRSLQNIGGRMTKVPIIPFLSINDFACNDVWSRK